MILYTDGLIEAKKHGEFLGKERPIAFTKNLKPTPAKEIPQALFNYVNDYTGGRLLDDIALLCIGLEDDSPPKLQS